MFIYSMRASTIKFCGVLCVALVALITLIAFVPAYGSEAPDASAGQNVDYNYEKIKTNDDRIEFLSQFGWQVKPNAVAEEEVLIPEQFDKVFSGYNEIQRRQGLDLSKYKKKLVNRYTYEVTNYNGYEGTVYANILVYRNRVIGGDICSADISGFLHGFEK
ncbi:MAG: DUF4830 domain-containing protein [Clostridia bacterium]|nr:DUF4830 domain-containing protein [Clostridia bacterium]MEE1115510.1 DUF4830 domain-containing protein [Clostridia bacterium]